MRWLSERRAPLLISLAAAAAIALAALALRARHPSGGDARAPVVRDDDVSDLFRDGQGRAARGDFLGAIRDYDQLLRLDPGHEAALQYKAGCQEQLGEFAAALQSLELLAYAHPSEENRRWLKLARERLARERTRNDEGKPQPARAPRPRPS